MRGMNDLQIFQNPEFGTIRTMLINDEPWAVGKDVATALGYVNPHKAIRDHVDDEDRTVNDSFTVNGTALNLINESGLYSLILSSKLPSAKRFKRWVTHEVLPTLRKTGSYSMTGARPLTADDYLTAARILSGCRNERLPYVLPLIRKAGIDIDISRAELHRGSAKDPETAKLLKEALNNGVSIRELERLTGIHTTQLYRMRDGTTKYNAARAAVIREVLQALAPELVTSE